MIFAKNQTGEGKKMDTETLTGFSKIIHGTFVLLLIYLCIVFAAYIMQNSMIYYPSGTLGSPKDNDLPEMKEVYIKTHDNLNLKAWFAEPSKNKDKVVVFFHGNAGNAGGRDTKARKFIDAGYGFLMAEYRGYGGNPGKPQEINIKKDAKTTIEFLKTKGYEEKDLILYGESIGTGVVTHLASRISTAAVILEAPFTSLLDVGKEAYWYLPVSLMLKEKYDSIGIIKEVNAPLLIVHGESDKVVPTKMGKKLLAAANEPKKGIFIPEAGHNNLRHYGSLKLMIKWLDDTLTNKQVKTAYKPKRFARRRDHRIKKYLY
ncbi:MAG: alpha/beta hydrolase [Alphaproteobacteria bacterium]|nr:alpha/beta hydrolase [Alphaproteobacteria bacterium]